jgi:hypothetical protein
MNNCITVEIELGVIDMETFHARIPSHFCHTSMQCPSCSHTSNTHHTVTVVLIFSTIFLLDGAVCCVMNVDPALCVLQSNKNEAASPSN